MENKPSILIVEDEQRIASFMRAVLYTGGYDPSVASTGQQAISMMSSVAPDVVILDLGLPDMDGLDLIRSIRLWNQVPIIVVSARMQEQDKVEALDLGADDYITKPFGSGELLARIRTALRHITQRSETPNKAEGCFAAKGLRIDYDKHIVTVDGESVHLTQNEYRILTLLSLNAGKVLTYDYILKALWGPAAAGDNQVLRVHMANLRRKLEKNHAEPVYISTEVGVGYRMVEAD